MKWKLCFSYMVLWFYFMVLWIFRYLPCIFFLCFFFSFLCFLQRKPKAQKDSSTQIFIVLQRKCSKNDKKDHMTTAAMGFLWSKTIHKKSGIYFKKILYTLIFYSCTIFFLFCWYWLSWLPENLNQQIRIIDRNVFNV